VPAHFGSGLQEHKISWHFGSGFGVCGQYRVLHNSTLSVSVPQCDICHTFAASLRASILTMPAEMSVDLKHAS